jgi:hypothetical protein
MKTSKIPLIASVAHARPLLEELKFFDENSRKKKKKNYGR